tara:strand:+ start:459 stop:662 length:204 start_codon:yes stop_codon:yes gene_type:complete
MKFYKIPKELDQITIGKIKLIGGELLTEIEAIKNQCLKTLKKEAETMHISKFKTHWIFGCRRENNIK